MLSINIINAVKNTSFYLFIYTMAVFQECGTTKYIYKGLFLCCIYLFCHFDFISIIIFSLINKNLANN